MIELIVTLVLDVLLATLLIATIGYCAKLSTRIKVLQDSKSELSQLIRQFNESTDRASASVIELQAMSKKVVEGLQTKIDKANFLADDLTFMIEKGNKLADQMEVGISGARKTDAKPVAPSRAETPRPAAAQTQESQVSPAASRAAGIERIAAASSSGGKSGTLESVLDKLSGKQAAASGKPAPTARMRSKAEQELLDALKRS